MAPAEAAASIRQVTPLGWLMIAVRLIPMALLLAICAPLHLLWRGLGLGRFWPRVFLGAVGAVAGLQVRSIGRPEPHALLIANHLSWLDILALARTAGSAFVAHQGLARFPLLRWLCEMNDTVFIARHDRRTISDQIDQVRAAVASGGTLTLFPEGTTGDGAGTLPFKPALLSAAAPSPPGVSVQPVAMDYEGARTIAWTDDEPGLDNVLRILSRVRPVRLTIRFLPPLPQDALVSRKAIATASRDAIQRALGECPVVAASCPVP